MANWLGNIVKMLLDIGFSLFGFHIDLSNLASTTKSLCNWNDIQTSTLGTIAKDLNEVFVPIGLSLLTVFVMIDLIKKAMEIDRISWERIVMSMVRFLIFKVLIEHSYEFLNMIMSVAGDFINKTITALHYSTASSADIGTTIGDLVSKAEGAGFLHWDFAPLLMFLVFLVMYFPIIGTYVMVVAQIFKRVINIILAFAFSPIPLAIGTWEDGSATGKKFIMSVVALAFEGILMIVCVHIYALGLKSILSGVVGSASFGVSFGAMVGILLMNGILTTALNGITQLTEKWTGA